jgi:short-subunit dehydrogenase
MLTSLANELEQQHGIKTRTVTVDVSRDDAAELLIQPIAGLEIGLFIANAGAGGGGIAFLEGSVADWQGLMNINIHMPMTMCHHLAGPMLERGRGGLLLMGSGVALGGQPRTSVYSASKAYSLNLAESLWAEFKPRGVDVLNVVAPLINTPTLQRGLGGRDISGKLPWLFEPIDVVQTALQQLAIGPCYVFPAGPEADNAEAVTDQRRARVKEVSKIAELIFGNND